MKLKEWIANFTVMMVVGVICSILLPFLLLWLLWQILYTPIGYMKFKASRYQKDFPQKYKWLRTPHVDNEMYTIVRENHLPIDYFKYEEDYELPGYFLYKETLLIFCEPFFFDEKKGLWLFCPNNTEESEEEIEETEEDVDADEVENTDDCLTVEETKEYHIEEFKRNIPDRACNRVVFFYQIHGTEKLYGADALQKLMETDGFVLYEKGKKTEAVTEYIERN